MNSSKWMSSLLYTFTVANFWLSSIFFSFFFSPSSSLIKSSFYFNSITLASFLMVKSVFSYTFYFTCYFSIDFVFSSVFSWASIWNLPKLIGWRSSYNPSNLTVELFVFYSVFYSYFYSVYFKFYIEVFLASITGFKSWFYCLAKFRFSDKVMF